MRLVLMVVYASVERWTYLATDVVDKHGYFGGKHEGDAAGYSVREGHTDEDACALTDPESVPISYLQTAGIVGCKPTVNIRSTHIFRRAS